MSITVDMSDFLDFADDCEKAAQAVPMVMQDAAMSLGFAVQGRAQNNAQARHTRGTGTMANTTTTNPKSVSATSASVEVVAPAVSAAGFPYPIVMDTGHDGIVPKTMKALAFPGRDGGMVFTKRVRPYPGSRWFSDAERDTKQSGDIEAVADMAADDLRALLRG